MAILEQSIFRRLKLFTAPLLLLICFTFTDVRAQKQLNKVKKVVIDAGHGGKDPGACGRIYYEKDIVLSVALRLGRLIEENLPDVEIIYTRNRDFFVELRDRSNIANKAGADLFISIHANANLNRDVVGVETFVMGNHVSQDNLSVAMRENAVIKYEDDYSENYEGFDPNSPESYIIFSLMQFSYLEKSIKMAEFVQNELKLGPIQVDRGVKQAGFWVLAKTAAPSILIEIGFISNIQEEERLGEPETQQTIANSLFKAFKQYKTNVESNTNIKTSNTINIQEKSTDKLKSNDVVKSIEDKEQKTNKEEGQNNYTPHHFIPYSNPNNTEKEKDTTNESIKTPSLPEENTLVNETEDAKEMPIVKKEEQPEKKTKEVKRIEYLYNETTGEITKVEKIEIIEEKEPSNTKEEYQEYYGKTINENFN